MEKTHPSPHFHPLMRPSQGHGDSGKSRNPVGMGRTDGTTAEDLAQRDCAPARLAGPPRSSTYPMYQLPIAPVNIPARRARPGRSSRRPPRTMPDPVPVSLSEAPIASCCGSTPVPKRVPRLLLTSPHIPGHWQVDHEVAPDPVHELHPAFLVPAIDHQHSRHQAGVGGYHQGRIVS